MANPAQPLNAELEARIAQWGTAIERDPNLWQFMPDPEFAGKHVAIASIELPGSRLLHISRYNVDGDLSKFNPAQAVGAAEGGPLMFASVEDRSGSGPVFLEEDAPDGRVMAEASLDVDATASQVVSAAIQKWGGELAAGPGLPQAAAPAAPAAAQTFSAEEVDAALAQMAADAEQEAADRAAASVQRQPAPAMEPVERMPAFDAARHAPQPLDDKAFSEMMDNGAIFSPEPRQAPVQAAAPAQQAHVPQPIPPHNPQAPFRPSNSLDDETPPFRPEIDPRSPEAPDELPPVRTPEIMPNDDPIIFPSEPPLPRQTPEIPELPPELMNRSALPATPPDLAFLNTVNRPAIQPAVQMTQRVEDLVAFGRTRSIGGSAPIIAAPAEPAPLPSLSAVAAAPASPGHSAQSVSVADLAARGLASEAPRNSRNVLLVAGACAALTLVAPAVALGAGIGAAGIIAHSLKTQKIASQEAPFLTRFGYAIGRAIQIVANAAREEAGFVRLTALSKAHNARESVAQEARRIGGSILDKVDRFEKKAIAKAHDIGRGVGQALDSATQPARIAHGMAAQRVRGAKISLSFLAAEGLDSIARAQERVASGAQNLGERRRAVSARATIAALSARQRFHEKKTALRESVAKGVAAVDRAFDNAYSMEGRAVSPGLFIAGGAFGGASLVGFGDEIAHERFDRAQFRREASKQPEFIEPTLSAQAADIAPVAQPVSQASPIEQAATPVAQAQAAAPAVERVGSIAPTPLVEWDGVSAHASPAAVAQTLANIDKINAERELQNAANAIVNASQTGVDLTDEQFQTLQRACDRGVMPERFPVLPTLHSLQKHDTPFAEAASALLRRTAQTLDLARAIDADHPIWNHDETALRALEKTESLHKANATKNGTCVDINHPAIIDAAGGLLRHIQRAGGARAFTDEQNQRFAQAFEGFLQKGMNPDANHVWLPLAHCAVSADFPPAVAALAKHGATFGADRDGLALEKRVALLPPASQPEMKAAIDSMYSALPDPVEIAERARQAREAKAGSPSASRRMGM